MSRLSLTVLIGLCVVGAAGVAVAQSTRPAASRPVEGGASAADDAAAVAALIGQLNDPDPDVRDQATKALWSRGRAVAPQLRAAAAGGPPEVARRARSILRDFMYGLYPDTPKPIFDALDQYRNGDLGQKQSAIWMLNSRGTAGLRVLLKLRQDESDPDLQKTISRALDPREHEVAVLLLAEGETAAAEAALEAAATSGTAGIAGAAQDYAAYLATSGKLAAKRETLAGEPLTPRNAMLRLALARAAGDLAAAKAAAEKIADADYLDAVLVEQGNWAALAARAESLKIDSTRRMEPAERLGFACTYYRLAGDEDNFRKAAARIVAHAEAAPQDYLFCAENLFLNALADEGEAVLLKHHDYLQASSYLASRLELKKALELPDLAQKEQPAEAIKVRARTAEALHFMGERERARRMLADAAAENRLRNDAATWGVLIDAARQVGEPALADEFCADVLSKATEADALTVVFQKMRTGDPSAAAQWWRFFRHDRPTDAPVQTVQRVRTVMGGTLAGEELTKLADAAEKYLGQLQPVERESWQENVGDALARAKLTDLAAKWFDRLAKESSNPRALSHAGDFEADRKNWAAAIDRYAAAWDRDHTRASALYLKGWALEQAGRPEEGRPLIELAEQLPLGSETARTELVETMRRHNLSDAALRETNLIVSVTPVRSFDRNEALRDLAEQAVAKSDFLTAVGLWERAFLNNLTNPITFKEPWANIVVPALIHKSRAMGLALKGDVDAALKEAKLTLKIVPADADALIDMVNVFDKSGHKPQADALYKEHTDFYRGLINDYPRSGPAHNQLAWAQVMCHRNLDDALANARRAVELEPASTASLDTLAEVYFARGDARSAAEQMRRCIELEPNAPRHRQQLARFEKGTGATTRPQ